MRRTSALYKLFLLLYAFFIYGGCTEKEPEQNHKAPPTFTAQEVVEAAIAKQGGAIIEHSEISFTFRDRQYITKRNGAQFTYERLFQDSSGQAIRDILTNTSFQRFTNDEETAVTEERATAYSNSVNSVIYFALLPYFLNDAAVKKSYLGLVQIKNRPYHKIKVTFQQEGGGKDFEDEYVYWFHQDQLTVDYLAYNYLVDGGGARFRQAYNRRTIEGVLFSDFVNYKPLEDRRDVENFDQLFEEEGLKELSRIDLEEISIKKL